MFDEYSITNPGGREQNEDRCGYTQSGCAKCWFVADGLGGHKGGQEAASLAVASVMTSFSSDPALTPEAIKKHLFAADEAIKARQKADRQLLDMKSTLVVLVSDGRKAIWGHAGDSRLYHFRAGRIVSRTVDHSAAQLKVFQGEIGPDELHGDKDASTLTQAAGRNGSFIPIVIEKPIDLCRNDSFLLCVDGFWGPVHETEMEIDWAKSFDAKEWLGHMRRRIENRIGTDSDNYTAVAVILRNPELAFPVAELENEPRSELIIGGLNPEAGREAYSEDNQNCYSRHTADPGVDTLVSVPPDPDSSKVEQSTFEQPLISVQPSGRGNEELSRKWKFAFAHVLAAFCSGILLGIGFVVISGMTVGKRSPVPVPAPALPACQATNWDVVDSTTLDLSGKALQGILGIGPNRHVVFYFDPSQLQRFPLAKFDVKLSPEHDADTLLLNPGKGTGLASRRYRLLNNLSFKESERDCLTRGKLRPPRTNCPAEKLNWPAEQIEPENSPGLLFLNSDKSISFYPSPLNDTSGLFVGVPLQPGKLNNSAPEFGVVINPGRDRLTLRYRNPRDSRTRVAIKEYQLVNHVKFSTAALACVNEAK